MALFKTANFRPATLSRGFSQSANSTGFSECGVGALMPWADALYVQTYQSISNSSSNGTGVGLWKITDPSDVPTLVATTNTCSTGRIVHSAANKLVIGCHIIDAAGNVTPISGFLAGGAQASANVCAYALDPYDNSGRSERSVLALSMEGQLYRVTLTTGTVTQLGNLASGQPTPYSDTNNNNVQAKMLHTTLSGSSPRVWAAFNNNPYLDGSQPASGGRLLVFSIDTSTGVLGTITDLDTNRASWINVAGSNELTTNSNGYIWATGQDDLSPILWLYAIDGSGTRLAPKKFRLPYGNETFKKDWQNEWQRLRSVESERFMLDLHGMFYTVSNWITGADNLDSFSNAAPKSGLPRMQPIAPHFKIVPDFCSWNGYLVLGRNNVSPIAGSAQAKYSDAGQSQGGLTFTDIDELGRGNKPTGAGNWWKGSSVTSGVETELMLARGFDKKQITFVNGTATAVNVAVNVYLENYSYVASTVTVPANGGVTYTAPAGDWISLTPAASCTSITARIDYT